MGEDHFVLIDPKMALHLDLPVHSHDKATPAAKLDGFGRRVVPRVFLVLNHLPLADNSLGMVLVLRGGGTRGSAPNEGCAPTGDQNGYEPAHRVAPGRVLRTGLRRGQVAERSSSPAAAAGEPWTQEKT